MDRWTAIQQKMLCLCGAFRIRGGGGMEVDWVDGASESARRMARKEGKDIYSTEAIRQIGAFGSVEVKSHAGSKNAST